MASQADMRYDRVLGWDPLVGRPVIGDLMVITTDRTGEKGKVVRLTEDLSNRQTAEVTDDLISGHGCHTRFNRRGDLRPLSSSDELYVKEG